jgi:hypothetical protein
MLRPLGQPSVALPTGFPALRFPSRQFRMEPRADLEQRSNPTFNLDLPGTLRRNPQKNLEQSRVDSRLPSASHPSGCLAAVSRAAARLPGSERLPRRLVARPIPPDDGQQLMPSPSGVRHLGCTKAFLRNLFFGPSQGPQLPALDLERNILERVAPVRRRSLRRDEGRGSRVEGFGRFFTTDITN